jgi:hypothetical protein
MLRHSEVQNSSAIMRDGKEAVQHTEDQRRYSEEVHRGDDFVMADPEPRFRIFLATMCLSSGGSE